MHIVKALKNFVFLAVGTLAVAGQAGAVTVHYAINGFLDRDPGSPQLFGSTALTRPFFIKFDAETALFVSVPPFTTFNSDGCFFPQEIKLIPHAAISNLTVSLGSYDVSSIVPGYQSSGVPYDIIMEGTSFAPLGAYFILSGPIGDLQIGNIEYTTRFVITGTGYASAVDGGFGTFRDLKMTASTAAVPEPATWAMLIGGFALVGSALRRREAVAGQARA